MEGVDALVISIMEGTVSYFESWTSNSFASLRSHTRDTTTVVAQR